jgi:hypothetical protein
MGAVMITLALILFILITAGSFAASLLPADFGILRGSEADE